MMVFFTFKPSRITSFIQPFCSQKMTIFFTFKPLRITSFIQPFCSQKMMIFFTFTPSRITSFIQPFHSQKNDNIFHLQTIKNPPLLGLWYFNISKWFTTSYNLKWGFISQFSIVILFFYLQKLQPLVWQVKIFIHRNYNLYFSK